MDTIRVEISYRPLRIGWAIQAGDIDAFRHAVRLSYALWGGRFNPILIADNDEETKSLVDLFRVDVIWPLGNGDGVKALPERFPHLINPTFHNTLFVPRNVSTPKSSMSTMPSCTCAIDQGGNA